MIDLLKQHFETLTAGYLIGEKDYDANIKLKIDHSYRVAQLSQSISSQEPKYGFDNELAYVAGLLHDVGRFEQYKKYRSFTDSKTENHGELGYKYLKNTDILYNTMPGVWREIVLNVAKTHNALRVSKELNSVCKRYVKLVRDADKIDVLDLFIKLFNQDSITPCLVHNLPITNDYSQKVAYKVIENKPVLGTELKTVTDFKLMLLCWFKDLNYSSSARVLIDMDLHTRLRETFPEDELIEKVYLAAIGSLQRKFSI